MSSNQIFPRMLNVRSGKPNLMNGIIRTLARGHHQIGVTVNALPRLILQAGSLASSGSFFIRRTVKLGLVTYPQKCLPFTCDVSRCRTFSSMTVDTQSAEIHSSQSNKTNIFKLLQELLKTPPKEQDVGRIEQTLEELDKLGLHKFNPLTTSLLMEFCCNQGNVEKAMLHYKRLHKDFQDFRIVDYRIINLATLLASKGQFDEAENMISEHSPSDPVPESRSGIWTSVLNLLTAIKNTGDIERARRMLGLLVEKGYYERRPPNEHLATLIKIHLERFDVYNAVKELMRTIEMYQCAPCLARVLKDLLKKSDNEKIKQVMDAASSVLSESTVQSNMVQAHLELDQLAPALKILKAPTVRMPERQLYHILEQLVINRKIETLEEFVKMTKDLPHANRDLMYYQLLRVYVEEKNVEKALEAWSSMQKEGVEPSESTLYLLGNFLKQNGQPVPFLFSETAGKYTFKKVKRRDRGEEEKRLTKLMECFLNEGRLADAKKVCHDMISDEMMPGQRILEKYAVKSSEVGDVDTFSFLQQQLPTSFFKYSSWQNYKLIAKINLGLYEEVVKSLEEIPVGTELGFPGKAFLMVLSKQPDSFDRLNRVAELHHQGGYSSPRNLIWIWLLKNGKFEEAKALFKATPAFSTVLHFHDVLDEIKNTRNVVLSRALLEQVSSTKIDYRQKGIVYSSHIDLLISMSKLDEALDVFEESQKNMQLTNIKRSTLESLEAELTSKGKPVPFSLPPFEDYVRPPTYERRSRR